MSEKKICKQAVNGPETGFPESKQAFERWILEPRLIS